MIRPLLTEELDGLCERIAAMDPWKLLEIQAEVMADNIRSDKERNILVWSEQGLIQGAVIYRRRNFAQLVYFHGFGPALAERSGLQWPSEWNLIPDGGYVSGLAVFPDYQGKKLGSLLLSEAEDEVRKAGQGRNYLMVTDFNRGARRLYERHGYRCIAMQDDCIMPGNREHLMEKLL